MMFPRLSASLPALLGAAVLSFIAGCDSSPSGPVPVVDPTGITVLPGAGTTLYAGLPTTFTISGGTGGTYTMTSNNQAALPVPAGSIQSTVTLVPNPVLTTTTVTLSVRDNGTTPIRTFDVVVQPNTVVNEIIFTPSATPGSNCTITSGTGTGATTVVALCSGGDALLAARLSQGGVPLAARGVRFDVLSGDIRLITSGPGAVETTATTITTATDETGRARIRVRATALAPNQTAIVQITDITTGTFQRIGIQIVQFTGQNPSFFVLPSAVTFTGPRVGVCAPSGTTSNVNIFGGSAPYTLSGSSAAFITSGPAVSSGSFSVTATGTCGTATIGVTDATGRTITFTATNQEGTTTPSDVVVSPNKATLTSCTASGSATVSGGLGPNSYVASSSNSAVTVNMTGNLVTFTRNAAAGTVPNPTVVNVSVTDGLTAAVLEVTLSGAGAGPCPTTPLSFTVNPLNVNACAPATFSTNVSGGTAPYSAIFPTGLTGSFAGITLNVQRVTGSGAMPATGTVTVIDSNGTRASLGVNVTSGPC